MMYQKMSIEDLLLKAQTVINNSLEDTDVLTSVSAYGYDRAKLNTGKELLDEVNTLHQQQKKEYGEQYESTDELYKAFDKADIAYMKTLKVARVAFKDDIKAQAALKLNGVRKRTIAGWLDQATLFYDHLISEESFKSAMAGFGYDDARLQAEKALVDEVTRAHHAQNKEMGEAQQATKDRDEKLDNLNEWLSDYVRIARVALYEKPQLMEKLGIMVPS